MIKTRNKYSKKFNRNMLVRSNEVQLAQLGENVINSANYCFNIDYLILNFRGFPSFENTKDFTFELQEYGTKVFKNRVKVFYKNKMFGVLLSAPKSKVINADLVQFQYENNLFYTLSKRDLHTITKRFMVVCDVIFKGINRLDLCLDYENKNEDMNSLFQSLVSEKIKLGGRTKAVTPHCYTDNGLIKLEGVSFGKRDQARSCKLYDKTREMKLKKNKTYIYEQWEKSKMNIENVWRFEYQLNAKYFTEWKKLSLNKIFSFDWLWNVFEICQENHLNLKENTGKLETNKEKNLRLFDLETLRKYFKSVKYQLVKLSQTIEVSLIGVQRQIKGLLRSYFSENHNLTYLNALKSLMKSFRLENWFYEKVTFYLFEFKYKEKVRTLNVDKFYNDLKAI